MVDGTRPPAPDPASTTAEANRALVRRYLDALNTGDLAALDDLLAPAYHTTGPEGDGWGPGPDGVRQWWREMRAVFPDQLTRIEEVIAEGDRVVVRYTWQATQQRPLGGITPTGRLVTVAGITIYRVAAGRLIERYDQPDRLGFVRQFGPLPTLGPTA